MAKKAGVLSNDSTFEAVRERGCSFLDMTTPAMSELSAPQAILIGVLREHGPIATTKMQSIHPRVQNRLSLRLRGMIQYCLVHATGSYPFRRVIMKLAGFA